MVRDYLLDAKYNRLLRVATAAVLILSLVAGCGRTRQIVTPALSTATSVAVPHTLSPADTPVPTNSPTGEASPTSTPLSNMQGTTTASAALVEEEVRVGLYAGAGAANACVTAAGEMFEWMGYTVEWIDADTVNDADLREIDVLYFPGGSAGPYQEDISAEGREKIQQLVRSGGCFIGTCAGALFAAEQVIWEGVTDPRPTLGLFPGTVQGPLPEIYADPEHGMCQVNLDPHPITGMEPGTVWILYYNGPFFSPNSGAEVDIVGRYEITNEPAIVAFAYGEGRVLLTGPHPEWEEDDDRDGVSYFDRFDDRGSDWDLMLNATRWCLGEID